MELVLGFLTAHLSLPFAQNVNSDVRSPDDYAIVGYGPQVPGHGLPSQSRSI